MISQYLLKITAVMVMKLVMQTVKFLNTGIYHRNVSSNTRDSHSCISGRLVNKCGWFSFRFFLTFLFSPLFELAYPQAVLRADEAVFLVCFISTDLSTASQDCISAGQFWRLLTTLARQQMRWDEVIGLAENLLREENWFSAGFSRLIVPVLGEPKTNGGTR